MAEDEKSAKSISRYVMERGSVVEIQCGENAALKFVSGGGSSESEVNLNEVSIGTPVIVRQSSLYEECVRFEKSDSATKEPKGTLVWFPPFCVKLNHGNRACICTEKLVSPKTTSGMTYTHNR